MDRPTDQRDQRSIVPEADPGTAFELFFEVEFERVFGTAYLATGSRQEAEALAHRAFLRTWDRWARVREMERPSLFPIRVAMSPIRMRVRRLLLALRGRVQGERPLEPFEDVALDDEVREVLVAMAWRRRAALTLTASLDLSPGETGRALGMRARHVRVECATAAEQLTAAVADRNPVPEAVDLLDDLRKAAAAPPRSFERHQALRSRIHDRRRIATIAIAVAVGVLAVFVASRGPAPGDEAAPDATPTPVRSLLPPGTYRLPGLSTTASVTLPAGWRAGDSIWGSDGPGFAAVTTGPAGGSVSVAVFDLAQLDAVDPVGHVFTRTPAHLRRWFHGFDGAFERRVRSHLGSAIAGLTERWEPVGPLPWILTRVPPGPVEVSEPIIGGRLGSLASFVNSGTATVLFGIDDTGTILLRPDVTYTFWVPRDPDAFGTPIMVGIARESGSIPTLGEWSVVGSLAFGS